MGSPQIKGDSLTIDNARNTLKIERTRYPKRAKRIAGLGERDFEDIRRTSLTPYDYSTIMLELVQPGLDNEKFVERVNFLANNLTVPIPELALAEWKYEMDKIFESLLLVADTIPTLDNADDA